MNLFGNSQIILPGNRIPRMPGWEALKKYAMPRDSEGLWLDSDDEKHWMYIKVVDANGIETCMRCHYEPDPPEEFSPDKYVTKEEFNSLREEVRNGFNSVRGAIESANK